jgi:heme O synthase-like polyprenyltransferase
MQTSKLNRRPAKWIFISALLIMTATILTVYLTGLTSSRSILANATILTVLSSVFFLFLTSSLYRGIKLKDDVGDLTKKIKWRKDYSMDVPAVSNSSEGKSSIIPDLDVGDGVEEIAAAVFFWIVATFVFIALLFLFETVIWVFILLLVAMLYWVFFRAVRLVLKNSARCRGKLSKAATYGLGYTLLYSSWMYAILLSVKYLR